MMLQQRLKIENKSGKTLCESSVIAGVDLEKNSVDGSDFVDDDKGGHDDDDFDDLVPDFVAELEAHTVHEQFDEDVAFHY